MDSWLKETHNEFSEETPPPLKVLWTPTFREMLLIHRNQTECPHRCCVPGSSGFSGTKCSTRNFVLQGMGIEAGGLEECEDKMVHVSFVLEFLKSHLALISGMAEHKDSHLPSESQILHLGRRNTGRSEGT